MLEYVLRLLIVLPLIGGLAFASLWLWTKAQQRLPARPEAPGGTRVVDVITLGANGRLIVVKFGERRLLLAAAGRQISLLSEQAGDD